MGGARLKVDRNKKGLGPTLLEHLFSPRKVRFLGQTPTALRTQSKWLLYQEDFPDLPTLSSL